MRDYCYVLTQLHQFEKMHKYVMCIFIFKGKHQLQETENKFCFLLNLIENHRRESTKKTNEMHSLNKPTPPVHPSNHTCPVSRYWSMKYERSQM